MRIDEFLLMRIAEDERAAHRGSRHNDSGTYANDNYGCLLVDPARVLVECEAKRRIMELHPPEPRYVEEWTMSESEPREVYVGTYFPTELRLLAAVYAAHPDYRQEWAL